MTSFKIDLNPITVEFEYRVDGTDLREVRYVVYLHHEVVKRGDWVPESQYWGMDTDDIRQEYTQLYEQFLAKRFTKYLGLTDEQGL